VSVEKQRQAEKLVPTLAVQTFRLATGAYRYYARIEWRADGQSGGAPEFAYSAWIATEPQLRILATEELTSPEDGFPYELPILLNVVDLGAGSTGIIMNIPGTDDDTLGLWEYKDGADLAHMRLFQSIVTDD
jgi:hypothetical protein